MVVQHARGYREQFTADRTEFTASKLQYLGIHRLGLGIRTPMSAYTSQHNFGLEFRKTGHCSNKRQWKSTVIPDWRKISSSESSRCIPAATAMYCKGAWP